jgi:deazaflavin-dependent oxidoreductase (nitroreductase family)
MTIPADMKAHNKQLIEQFRAAGGAPEGRALLLLTTTGRRSGEPYTTPMMWIPDGDRLLVIASNAGAPRDPDWFRNLQTDPHVTVEITGETFETTAVIPDPGERDRLWADVTSKYPFFVEHQAKAGRTIPVVILPRP